MFHVTKWQVPKKLDQCNLRALFNVHLLFIHTLTIIDSNSYTSQFCNEYAKNNNQIYGTYIRCSITGTFPIQVHHYNQNSNGHVGHYSKIVVGQNCKWGLASNSSNSILHPLHTLILKLLCNYLQYDFNFEFQYGKYMQCSSLFVLLG